MTDHRFSTLLFCKVEKIDRDGKFPKVLYKLPTASGFNAYNNTYSFTKDKLIVDGALEAFHQLKAGHYYCLLYKNIGGETDPRWVIYDVLVEFPTGPMLRKTFSYCRGNIKHLIDGLKHSGTWDYMVKEAERNNRLTDLFDMND